jgi:serine protease Do
VEGDSPAAKAGVKAGDKVLKVGDKPVKDQRELRAALDGSPAKTTVTVKRGDKEETLPVTFGG